MNKPCSDCKQIKSTKDFHPDKSRSGGFTGYCKNCHNSRCREYRKRTYNSEKSSERAKNWSKNNPDKKLNSLLKARYGITLDQYNAILYLQKSVCAICKKSEHVIDKRNNKLRSLSVDHAHDTQKIRGLLCMACNIVLGKVKDDVLVLKSAVAYLERHS